MPSHAPPSAREDRGPAAAPLREPYYYSNEDIVLLHQIVSLGQELLPTLPKREQLPTTALFRAADIVFPQYGISPDGEDKFSRVIFLVGGMRSTDNLYERFRTVLAKMGIEIEYVDGDLLATSADRNERVDRPPDRVDRLDQLHASPPSPPPLPSPPTPTSSAAAVLATSSPLDLARPATGWRRADDKAGPKMSQAQLPQEQQQPQMGDLYNPPPPPPSLPPSPPNQPPSVLPLRPPHRRHRSDGLNVTFAEKDQLVLLPPLPIHSSSQATDTGPQVFEDDEEDDEDDDNEDDDEEYEQEEHEHEHGQFVDQYTRSLDLLLGHPESDERHRLHHLRNHHDLQNPRTLPIRPKHPLAPATLPAVRESTPSTQTADDLDRGPPPKVDPAIMARVADTFFLRLAFLRGQAVQQWRQACAQHRGQAQYAEQLDRELCLSDAAFVWSDRAGLLVAEQEPASQEGEAEQAVAAEQEGEAAQAQDDPPEDNEDDEGDAATDDESTGAQEIYQQREQTMRRAARAYDISLMHTAFTHWRAMAAEEADRTKVARRHLVRRKVFDAWRAQTAHDEATVRTLTLTWSVRRWCRRLVQKRRADHRAATFHVRDALAVGLWTWLRAYQERRAVAWRTQQLQTAAVTQWRAAATQSQAMAARAAQAADVSERDWRRQLLGAAAAHWSQQTQTQSAVWRRIEEQEAETYAAAALQDLQKQARLEQQLRRLQAQHAAALRQTAAAVWWEAMAAAQEQAAVQDGQLLQAYAVHWMRETRLAQFRADGDWDLKVEAAHSWMLAEKLAFFQRYRDEQLVRRACAALQMAADDRQCQRQLLQDQTAPVLCADQADALRRTHLMQQALTSLRAAWQQQDELADMARGLADGTRAATALDALAAATQAQAIKHGEMEALAQRGAFYVAVSDALAGWGAHARSVREDRLRATYKHFRRRVKQRTAAVCVHAWQQQMGGPRMAARPVQRAKKANTTTTKSAGISLLAQTADRLRRAHETDLTVRVLDTWVRATNDQLALQDVAAELDVEAYATRWRWRLAIHSEASAAAAELSTAAELTGRWDAWELQAVQAAAHQHTATALREKNDRRLLRRVLGVWQDEWAAAGAAEATAAEAASRAAHGHAHVRGASTPSTARATTSTLLPLRTSTQRWSVHSPSKHPLDRSVLHHSRGPPVPGGSSSSAAWRLGSSMPSSTATTANTTPYSDSPAGAADRGLDGGLDGGGDDFLSSMYRKRDEYGRDGQDDGPASFLLHPILEGDLPSSPMALKTPVATSRWSRATNPFRSAQLTPGAEAAAGSGPHTSSAAAAGTFAGGRTGGTGGTDSGTGGTGTGGPAAAVASTRQPQLPPPPLLSPPQWARSTSRASSSVRLRQRLQDAASRLASSVPLGPMVELEDDRDDAHDADASSEGDDFFLSQLAAPTPAAPVALPTTTPMGPLPSPFERQLRAAYRSSVASEAAALADRGRGRYERRGLAATLATPMPSRLAQSATFAYDDA